MKKNFIFDWKQTLYDPDRKQLIKGTVGVLDFLRDEKIPMILIGKGSHDMHSEVKRLGVKDYFDHINFRDGPKDLSLYTDFINPKTPKKTVFVGDRVRSELAVGNSLGATTIWIRQGEFAAEEPENPMEMPAYTFTSLADLEKFLRVFL